MKKIPQIILFLFIPLLAQEDRGRVIIENNSVIAANGALLRGEHMRVVCWEGWQDSLESLSYWKSLRDTYHLNCIRLLCYQEPIYAPTYPPDGSCPDTVCQCLEINKILPLLDKAIENAREAEMYCIIDFHPVGDVDTAFCRSWWDVVAPRYKDRTHVIYELSNEPVSWSSNEYTNEDVDWEEYMYSVLRNYAPDTHIILWTFATSNSNMKSKVDQANIIYSNVSVGYHYYSNNNDRIIDLKNSYPIFMSEFQPGFEGGDPFTDMSNMADWHNTNNISWIALDGLDYMNVNWPKDPYDSLSPNKVQNVRVTK
jgi:hypothetical protein